MLATGPESSSMSGNLTFMCAFCGETIIEGHTRVMADPYGREQYWWTHSECFIQALHELARIDPNE